MTPLTTQAIPNYFNVFENVVYKDGKPTIEPLLDEGAVQWRRVTLKAGTELKCHKTERQVIVVWLRGKACFTADGQEYIMQPGTALHMPAGTPHGAKAETDCVFTVIKIAAATEE